MSFQLMPGNLWSPRTIAVCGLGTSLGCFEDDKPHPYILAFNASWLLKEIEVCGGRAPCLGWSEATYVFQDVLISFFMFLLVCVCVSRQRLFSFSGNLHFTRQRCSNSMYNTWASCRLQGVWKKCVFKRGRCNVSGNQNEVKFAKRTMHLLRKPWISSVSRLGHTKG